MNPTMKQFKRVAEKIDLSEDQMVEQILHAIVSISGAISSLTIENESLPVSHRRAIQESIESLKREREYLQKIIGLLNGEV